MSKADTTKTTHPYTPPRPVGTDIYGPVWADPPGSLFLYRYHYKIIRWEEVQAWEDWPGPLPVEVIVCLGKEVVADPGIIE